MRIVVEWNGQRITRSPERLYGCADTVTSWDLNLSSAFQLSLSTPNDANIAPLRPQSTSRRRPCPKEYSDVPVRGTKDGLQATRMIFGHYVSGWAPVPKGGGLTFHVHIGRETPSRQVGPTTFRIVRLTKYH